MSDHRRSLSSLIAMQKLPHDIIRVILSFVPINERWKVLQISRFFLNFNYQGLIIEKWLKKDFDLCETISLSKLSALHFYRSYQGKGKLPAVKELSLFGWFVEEDRFLTPFLIPDSIEHLYLSGWFHFNPILPKNLKILEIGRGFHHPLNLPEGLEELYFTDGYNKSLKLPQSLKILAIDNAFLYNSDLHGHEKRYEGGLYDQPLDLPEGLEELSIGGQIFNHPLTLPLSLKKLTVGGVYNQELVFPEGLEELILVQNVNVFGGRIYQIQGKIPIGCKVIKV